MNKILKVTYKILFGVLGLSAVVTEIVVLVNRHSFNPANFFSYFTILSNIFAFTMLLVGAHFLMKDKQSSRINILRGAATLYMVVTGIVFVTLLANVKGATLTAVPWDNVVLHYIIPIVILVDWLLIDRPTTFISYGKSLVWLLFPILYLVYSLIRGSIIHWYPYPFLNPASNGYLGILVTGIGISAVSIVLSFLLVRLVKLQLLRRF